MAALESASVFGSTHIDGFAIAFHQAAHCPPLLTRRQFSRAQRNQ
ncbi:hypothetical protein [Amycolatopsis sp. NPDC003861]